MSRTHHARRKRGTKKPIPVKAGRSEYTRSYVEYTWVVRCPGRAVVDRIELRFDELHCDREKGMEVGVPTGLRYACFDYPTPTKIVVQFAAEPRTWAAHTVNFITRLTGVTPVKIEK